MEWKISVLNITILYLTKSMNWHGYPWMGSDYARKEHRILIVGKSHYVGLGSYRQISILFDNS